MDREAYLFPPESSDLDKPIQTLVNTQINVKKALAALAKFTKHVSEFNEVGSGKRELLMSLQKAMRGLEEEAKNLVRAADHLESLKEDVLRAFHDPEHTFGKPNYVEVYSYDRTDR
jgi:hypothetical protein